MFAFILTFTFYVLSAGVLITALFRYSVRKTHNPHGSMALIVAATLFYALFFEKVVYPITVGDSLLEWIIKVLT